VHTDPQILEVVRWLSLICGDDLIASYLNRNGLKTGKGNRWTRERVCSLRSHYQIACFCPERKSEEGWLNLSEAAQHLGVCGKTVRQGIEQGQIKGQHPLADGPWIVKRQDLVEPQALEFIRRLRRRPEPVAGQDSDQINLF
jgi:hypothetical protein